MHATQATIHEQRRREKLGTVFRLRRSGVLAFCKLRRQSAVQADPIRVRAHSLPKTIVPGRRHTRAKRVRTVWTCSLDVQTRHPNQAVKSANELLLISFILLDLYATAHVRMRAQSFSDAAKIIDASISYVLFQSAEVQAPKRIDSVPVARVCVRRHDCSRRCCTPPVRCMFSRTFLSYACAASRSSSVTAQDARRKTTTRRD